MEVALIYIVNQGCLDSMLVQIVDKLAKSTHFMHAPTRRLLGSMSLITPIDPIVKKQVDKMV